MSEARADVPVGRCRSSGRSDRPERGPDDLDVRRGRQPDQPDPGRRCDDFTVDAANRVLLATSVSGRTTYSYDLAGNQTEVEVPSGDVTTTTWDAESRQQAVVKPDGSRVTFTYNCDHWRWAGKTGSGSRTSSSTRTIYWPNYTNEPNEFGNVISQHTTADGESQFFAFDAPGSANVFA